MKQPQQLSIRYARARLNILALVSPRKAAIKAFRLFCTPQQRASGKESAVFRKGQRLSFRLEGHTVRGHRWLPGAGSGAGPQTAIPLNAPFKRVLIAHGFESASRNFDVYIAALLKKGYEVVAFDAPAHGRSGGGRILLPGYVAMLNTIQRNFGPFHSFLGHSLGGLALTLFLEKAPQDPDTKLVLIAPATETTSALHFFSNLLHLSADVRKEMDAYVQEITGHPLGWFSLRRALGQVEAPILYIQDEEDRVTPLKDALLIQKDGHSNIHFIFTRGLGHRKIYKDEGIVGQAVDFL